MKPIEFPKQNIVYAKDQPEYVPLPAFKMYNIQGEIVSCWKLSFLERLRLLLTGELWVSIMTFNKSLSPVFLTTIKNEILTTIKQ